MERSIDLLLLDMDLPRKQAWLLLEDIKDLQVHTFCIALVSTTQERQLATMSGVNAVLTKGFSTRELANAVVAALGQAGESRRRCRQHNMRAFNG
jgi:DNA-binding response OmpR family regulator